MRPINFRFFIENTKRYMGNRFYPYNFSNNICQIFVKSLLKANGLLTRELDHFISQDAITISKNYLGSTVSNIANTMTNIANKFDVLRGDGVFSNLKTPAFL